MNTIDCVLEDIKRNDNIRIAFIYNLLINEPMGIACLSAYIKKYFPHIEIEFFDPKIDTLDTIKDFCPNFVFYSIMSTQYKENIERNRLLKKELKPFVSIFGGPHPTYFPDMINDEGVDIICQGEGEIPIWNLLNAVFSHSDIRHINGLWVKYNNTIYKNSVGNLIEDLNELPFPDRTLFYRKSTFLRNYSKKTVLSARGCPFKCSYCYNSGLNTLFKGKGKTLRHRSPKSVVDEIVKIKSRYNLRFIVFNDDVFPGMRLKWLKEFNKHYSKVKIPYNISIRAELVTEEIAKYLRISGCISAGMAIEYGDYEYRKKYLFRNMTNKTLINATRMLEREGIRVASPILIGLPLTDINGDLDTLKLVCKANPTYSNTSIFQPYPGLPLTDLCHKHNLINESYLNKSHNDFYTSANIRNIDYEKIIKLHNSYGILRLLYNLFNIDVEKYYKFIPDCTATKWINIVIKFFSFNKAYNYKRGLMDRIREISVALTSGIYGFSIKKRKPGW